MKLAEVYNIRPRKILKEEFDFSKKRATLYHLTGGFNSEQYNQEFFKKYYQSEKEFSQELEDKKSEIESRFEKSDYPKERKSRLSSIFTNIEQEMLKKDRHSIKDRARMAYHFGKKIVGDPWSNGTYFMPGSGRWHGTGLYTCYELNPGIRSTYGDIILRFEADIENFLCFNVSVAKSLHGEKYKLEDQFATILERKGLLDSINENDITSGRIHEFKNLLEECSNSYPFNQDDKDPSPQRSAGLVQKILYGFSELFEKGHYMVLSEIIDGIILDGRGDGPICIVYNPFIIRKHNMTGIGYFDENDKPIIKNNIGLLLSDRKEGADLDQASETSFEIDDSVAEDEFNYNEKLRNKFSNYQGELDLTREIKLKKRAYEKLEVFRASLKKVKDDAIKSKSLIEGPTAYDLCKDIIELRLKNTTELNNYFESMTDDLLNLRLGISQVAKPVIEFINEFGPGMDIVSSEEFNQYAECVYKIFNAGNNIKEVIASYPSLKFIDVDENISYYNKKHSDIKNMIIDNDTYVAEIYGIIKDYITNGYYDQFYDDKKYNFLNLDTSLDNSLEEKLANSKVLGRFYLPYVKNFLDDIKKNDPEIYQYVNESILTEDDTRGYQRTPGLKRGTGNKIIVDDISNNEEVSLGDIMNIDAFSYYSNTLCKGAEFTYLFMENKNLFNDSFDDDYKFESLDNINFSNLFKIYDFKLSNDPKIEEAVITAIYDLNPSNTQTLRSKTRKSMYDIYLKSLTENLASCMEMHAEEGIYDEYSFAFLDLTDTSDTII